MTLRLDDEQNREVEFVQSVFEYKSPVIASRCPPSNMDVVLIGHYADNREKKVVLFLESKFAEYYRDADRKSKEISNRYLDVAGSFYENEDFFSAIGVERKDGEKNFSLQMKNPGEKCYLDGLKQMISHYIGVRNVMQDSTRGDARGERVHVQNAIEGGADVYLGEIVFDYKIGDLPLDNGTTCLKSYENVYGELAKTIKEHAKESKLERFHMLPKLLKYSEFWSESNAPDRVIQPEHTIEPKILKFYFGEPEK